MTVPVPTGLSAVAVSPTEIDISWRDPPIISYYVIYRDSQKLAPVFGATTSYHDTNLTPSKTYVYRVQALAAGGRASKKSSSKSATTPPPAPTNLVATAQPDGSIELTWTASTDPAVTNYNIYRGTDKTGMPTDPVMTIDGSSTNFNDPNLGFSTTYYYTVKAIDAAGTSAPSNVAYAQTGAG